MKAADFYEKCNEIANATVPVVSEDFAGDFAEDFAEPVYTTEQGNVRKEQYTVKRVRTIELPKVIANTNTLLNYAVNAVSPNEDLCVAMEAWEKRIGKPVRTPEEFVMSYARVHFATELNGDVVNTDMKTIQELSPSVMGMAKVQETTIMPKEIVTEALSSFTETVYNPEDLEAEDECDEYKQRLQAGVEKGTISAFDARMFWAVIKLTGNEILDFTNFNQYWIQKLCDRLQSHIDIGDKIGASILYVTKEKKLRISDTTEFALSGMLKCSDFTEPTVALLNNGAGVLVYENSFEESITALKNFHFSLPNSLEQWADSDKKFEDFKLPKDFDLATEIRFDRAYNYLNEYLPEAFEIPEAGEKVLQMAMMCFNCECSSAFAVAFLAKWLKAIFKCDIATALGGQTEFTTVRVSIPEVPQVLEAEKKDFFSRVLSELIKLVRKKPRLISIGMYSEKIVIKFT